MDTKESSNIELHQRQEMHEQRILADDQQSAAIPTSGLSPEDTPSLTTNEGRQAQEKSWMSWYSALKEIFPIYLATHLAFITITCLSILFVLKDFSWQAYTFRDLLYTWDRWDTTLFQDIAQHGYFRFNLTAFFPLYPLLERVLMPVTHNNPFLAGLLISNLAGLGLFIMLYRLVKDDFNAQQAEFTVLYFALFPTAFYFASGYNESLFIFLAVLTLYELRHQRWWMAGLFGLLACLTRSAGILLFVPFLYEFLRLHQFQLKTIRWNILAIALLPLGLSLYAAWCYIQYHDALAFSHAQTVWNRYLAFPGYDIYQSILQIQKSFGLLSFQSLRNLTDLLPDLFVLLFIILSFVGPWRLPRDLWVYGIYAITFYIFMQLFPNGGTGLFPLESVGRFMLEVFPVFIVAAALGKQSKTFHLCYLMVSGAALFFLLTQFLTGHWVL
jgi:Gpi18-like mannosyltransferase